MSLPSPGSRRVFLQVLGASALVSCLHPAEEANGRFKIGNVKDVDAPGKFKVSETEVVAVFRDDGGLYAMSLVCTHQLCDIRHYGEVTADKLTCNCHGSQFDADGKVIMGPAEKDLAHYLVEVDGSGDIFVNADETVAVDTRVSPA